MEQSPMSRHHCWSLECAELPPACNPTGNSVVIHLAGIAHVRGKGFGNEESFRKLNVEATRRLAESAASAGVSNFIFLSSIGVFGGESGDGIFTEDSQMAPQTPYAMSKLSAEECLREISSRTGMSVTVLRPPVVIGPDAPGNLATLVAAVRNGIPLPFSTVRNARQLIVRENLVDAVLLAAGRPGKGFAAFNVANPEQISTPELCRRIGFHAGCPARLFSVPVSLLRNLARLAGRHSIGVGMTGNLKICTDAIEKELRWSPSRSLDEGIQATAE